MFGLLTVYTGGELSSDIYIAYQRKFVVPEMEAKFGFRGGNHKIVFEGTEYTRFVIDSVEPGGSFDQAGFKPGDMPVFHECRFFWINRTSESRFYGLLSYLRDDAVEKFRVVNFDEYKKTMNHYEGERKIFLLTKSEPCAALR